MDTKVFDNLQPFITDSHGLSEAELLSMAKIMFSNARRTRSFNWFRYGERQFIGEMPGLLAMVEVGLAVGTSRSAMGDDFTTATRKGISEMASMAYDVIRGTVITGETEHGTYYDSRLTYESDMPTPDSDTHGGQQDHSPLEYALHRRHDTDELLDPGYVLVEDDEYVADWMERFTEGLNDRQAAIAYALVYTDMNLKEIGQLTGHTKQAAWSRRRHLTRSKHAQDMKQELRNAQA